MSPLSLSLFGKKIFQIFQIFESVVEMFLHIQSLNSEIGAEWVENVLWQAMNL